MRRLELWLCFFEALSGLLRAYLTPAYPQGQRRPSVSHLREVKAAELLHVLARMATWRDRYTPIRIEVSSLMDDGVRWGFDVRDQEGEDRWPTQLSPLRQVGLMRPGQIADLMAWQTGEVTTRGDQPVDEATAFEVGEGRIRLAWVGEKKPCGPPEVLEDLGHVREWIALYHRPAEECDE